MQLVLSQLAESQRLKETAVDVKHEPRGEESFKDRAREGEL